MLAADGDRDRVEAALREHYVRGRLTLEEFTDRAGRVLTARSRADLRHALAGLPALPDVDDIAAPVRSAARLVFRGAMVVALTGAWMLFSLALLFVLGLVLLFGDVSEAALVGFLVVWLVPTYLLTRLWRART
jgi:Flp pilus assembly protein TadB